MRRSNRSRSRLVGSLVLGVGFAIVSSCHDDGGGGSSDSEDEAALVVLAAFAGEAGTLPAPEVALNARIVIECSVEIDPETVSSGTVRIETDDAAGPVPAEGEFLIDGRRIVFLPRLPVQPRLEDSGLRPASAYRIVVPGLTERGTIRSRRGRVPASNFRVDFDTRSIEPLFEDPSSAPLRVIGALVDLDGDGRLDGDGLPETLEPEEFFDLDSVPPVSLTDAAPRGTTSRPPLFGLFLSEPVRPEPAPGGILSLLDGRGVEIPSRVTLSQSLRGVDGGARVVIAIEPRARLAALSDFGLSARGAIDFGSPPATLEPFSATFRTTDRPVVASDAIVERFETQDEADPRSTALWNIFRSGRLRSGTGLGGGGLDGDFDFDALPATGRLRRVGDDLAIFETDPDGTLAFSSFHLGAGRELRCEGVVPARILVAGHASIEGTLSVRGRDGRGATAPGETVAGGDGGPGGGRGGDANPNGTASISLSGVPGEPAFGVSGTTFCNHGDGFRAGGCAGGRAESGAGSGGGGGHRDVGRSDNPVSPRSGLGGLPHGTETIEVLTGGSGGGGGGNDEDGLPFTSDDPGGSGGGGGGALHLEVGGRLLVTGAIDASGGRGGHGVRQSGAGGGGAGGSVRIRASEIAPLASGSVAARGGLGGFVSAPGRPGGGGSTGRIRVETVVGGLTVDRSRFSFDPPESSAAVSPDLLGRSRAVSLYYATGDDSPRYSFDGSDPATGALARESTGDLTLASPIPEGASARIVFFGAREDASRPFHADPSTESGPVTDVTALDGFPFIRFEIEFTSGDDSFGSPETEVESLRVNFTTSE